MTGNWKNFIYYLPTISRLMSTGHGHKVWSQINEEAPVITMKPAGHLFAVSGFMKIAAAILILIGLGTATFYIFKIDPFSKSIIASTGNDQKNQKIQLSDGSTVTLNRNTELTCKSNFGKRSRKVSLSGEAFFEIAADASKPFTIDAGKARIKVVGTSFQRNHRQCRFSSRGIRHIGKSDALRQFREQWTDTRTWLHRDYGF